MSQFIKITFVIHKRKTFSRHISNTKKSKVRRKIRWFLVLQRLYVFGF